MRRAAHARARVRAHHRLFLRYLLSLVEALLSTSYFGAGNATFRQCQGAPALCAKPAWTYAPDMWTTTSSFSDLLTRCGLTLSFFFGRSLEVEPFDDDKYPSTVHRVRRLSNVNVGWPVQIEDF